MVFATCNILFIAELTLLRKMTLIWSLHGGGERRERRHHTASGYWQSQPNPSRIWIRERVRDRAVKHGKRKLLAERSVDFVREGHTATNHSEASVPRLHSC